MRGKFIAFEGLDGSGQSTQVSKLVSYLKEKGYKVSATKEPTDNIIGGLIRGQLTKHWQTSQECLQLLFAADRAHHIEKEIIPILDQGNIAVTDRYMFSTIAFGSISADYDWLRKLNEKFILPDLTILLKVPAEECVRRIKEDRLSIELFEEKEKLEKVWRNYERLLKDYPNIKVVDGNKPVEEVFEDIRKEVDKIL